MNASWMCEALIKRVEPYLGTAKKVYGEYQYGYGHVDGVKRGHVISQDNAELLLQDDVKRISAELSELLAPVLGSMKQNEFDALVAFCHQVKVKNFRDSELMRAILACASKEDIALQMSRYTCDSYGGISYDLVMRREAEIDLFMKE